MGQPADNAPYFKEYQNHYSIFHWTTSNGLPQSHVSGITQTHNRLLWLSTYNGIVSFDGKRFNSLNQTIKKRNLSLFITSITAIGDSLIWTSTKEAVIYYNKKIISVYKFRSKDIFIPSIRKYGNEIYFFSHKAAFKLNKNKLVQILDLTKNKKTESSTILTCQFYRGKLTYLLSDGNKSKILLQNPQSKQISILNPGAKILNLCVANSELLFQKDNQWFRATTNYTIGKVCKTYKTKSGSFQQSAIEKEIDFFYNGKELEINAPSSREILNIDSYMQGNELFSSYTDHTGNLWLATNSDGIYMFRHFPFYYPTKTANLRISNSSHSFVDKQGIVWFDDECKETYGIELASSKLVHQITNVCNWANATWSKDTIVMFAFGTGHTWYNTKTRKSSPITSVPFPINYCFRYDAKHLILGTPGKLYLWDGKKTKLFKKFKNPETTCNQVLESKECFCFATSEGLYCLKGKTWTHLLKGKKLPIDCRSILKTKDEGNLLIGTAGNGIQLYNPETNTCTSLTNAPPALNECWAMVEDRFGQLWMSSNNGIVQVNLNQLVKSFKTKRASFLVNHYRFESGIQNVEFNSRTPNKAYLCKNGDIIFSSLVGPLVIKPQNNAHFNKVLADILIEDINVNDQPQNAIDKKLTIKEGDFVQVSFTLSTFSIERSLQFEYRIKGYRDDWTAINGRQITLDNLPSGSYDLQIQLSSGKRATSLHFDVKKENPNAWLWLLLLLMVSLLVIIYLTVRITRYFQKKKNATENLKQQVRILEIDALQAQMNPHFVFNCLNTIQFLFMSGNNARANKYLSDFSSLLRSSLELMRESVTTLDKELKATQLYIHLEKLQFDDGFEFRLIDNLKTPHTSIPTPTLFLQLFVENAIIHGLKNTDELNPILTMTMNENNTHYIYTISDNGPGFSETSRNGHKSLGLELLRERFKLKRELFQWDIDFEIQQNDTVIDDVKTTIRITIGKNWNEPI